MENGVRLETIGDFGRIPERSRNRFRQCMDRTAVNNKLTLIAEDLGCFRDVKSGNA